MERERNLHPLLPRVLIWRHQTSHWPLPYIFLLPFSIPVLLVVTSSARIDIEEDLNDIRKVPDHQPSLCEGL